MSREVKRVPLGFDAPLGQTWEGYIPPNWRACPNQRCSNGLTMEGRALNIFAHLLTIPADENRRKRHPWIAELPFMDEVGPLTEWHQLTIALAGREPSIFGHDESDIWRIADKIREAAGLPESWSTCQTCDGHSVHPDDIAASEAWDRTEPPVGDGWQMWSGTNDGPMSPVFATAIELAEWLSSTGASVFGSEKADTAGWMRIIDAGWIPSMVMVRKETS